MPKRYFISRHPGAAEWAHQQGLAPTKAIPHLGDEMIGIGDVVIGTLPVHLAAAICARGARFYNLSLDVPKQWRGRELTAEELHACGARLERFDVRLLSDDE